MSRSNRNRYSQRYELEQYETQQEDGQMTQEFYPEVRIHKGFYVLVEELTQSRVSLNPNPHPSQSQRSKPGFSLSQRG